LVRRLINVTGRKSNKCSNLEMEIERDVAVPGVTSHPGESRSSGYGLTATRMADQCNTVHVHLFEKRTFLAFIPFLPYAQMLQKKPGTCIYVGIFKIFIPVPAIIEKVLIH